MVMSGSERGVEIGKGEGGCSSVVWKCLCVCVSVCGASRVGVRVNGCLRLPECSVKLGTDSIPARGFSAYLRHFRP